MNNRVRPKPDYENYDGNDVGRRDVDRSDGLSTRSLPDDRRRRKQSTDWWQRIEDDRALIRDRELRLWTAGSYGIDYRQMDSQWTQVSGGYRLTPYNNMWMAGKKHKLAWSEGSTDGSVKKPKDGSGLYISHDYSISRHNQVWTSRHEYAKSRTFDGYPPYELSYANFYGFIHSIDRIRRPPRSRSVPVPSAPTDSARPPANTGKPPSKENVFRLGMISPAGVIVAAAAGGRSAVHASRKMRNGVYVYEIPYVYDKQHEYNRAREYNLVHQYTPRKPSTPSSKPMPENKVVPLLETPAVSLLPDALQLDPKKTSTKAKPATSHADGQADRKSVV